MMDIELNIFSFMEYAEKFFPNKKVISRTHEGIFEFGYDDIAKRTRSLAKVLKQFGVEKGDKVGTFAWNHHRHLEAYFGIPKIGGVFHTVNIRLSEEHLIYIINHAEDKILLIDPDLVPIIEKIKDKLKTVEAFFILSDADHIPETSLTPVYAYEDLIEKVDESINIDVAINENDCAGLCYTSGTTGNPKGVVYSHRGISLHTMMQRFADTVAMSETDVCLPVVPMFHANAWGFPFSTTWAGSTQVLPGPSPTAELIADLIDQYKVTITAAVPTIWLDFLKILERGEHQIDSIRMVLCGGTSVPKEMIDTFESTYNIPFIQGYGMTESSPQITLSLLKSHQMKLPKEERLKLRAKQGKAMPGLDIKVVNADGEVKHDGEEMGELIVRGHWIADAYYKDDRSEESFIDGWFHTKDIVTIDEEGSIQIVDRLKDVIKSGGEWISSVDLENALAAHEAVQEVAVVSIPHERWQERPVACVVLNEGANVTKEVLIDYLRPEFAKWWLPDDVIFMDTLPRNSAGKLLKIELREQMKVMYS